MVLKIRKEETTVQLQGYIFGCSVVVSLSVESNVFAMLYLAVNLNVNTMHNYNYKSGLDMNKRDPCR